MPTAIRRFIVAVSMIALTTVAAPAAHASVSDVQPAALNGCTHGMNTSGAYAWAHCRSGTGTYRAVAYCRNVVTGGRTVRYGAFVHVPRESLALCSSQERVYDHAIHTG